MGERMDELVDRGYLLDQKIKELESERDEIKRLVRQYAKKHKTSTVEGTSKGNAHVSPYSSSVCDPKDLLDKLTELDRASEFTSLVNVVVGPTKKAIGEMIFNEIAETDTIPYHVVKFKKKPKEKKKK